MTQNKANKTETKTPEIKAKPVYKHGENHFHAETQKDAIFQVASFLVMADSIKSTLRQHPEQSNQQLDKILEQSSAPLFEIKEDKHHFICVPEDLNILVKLIAKHDKAMVNAVNKVDLQINLMNENLKKGKNNDT